MAATSASLSPPIFLSTFNPKLRQFASSTSLSFQRIIPVRNPVQQNYRRRRSIQKLHAISEETLASESTTLVQKSQEIVSTSDDGVSSNVISVLLFVAFIGLSILTFGVIYIAVADFLQKREREKYDKEEAARKKSGKKKKVRAKTGPRGFGQKIEEDEED